MRVLVQGWLIAGVVLSAASSDAAAPADAGTAPSVPACVQVQSESRYVPYGYNHIVHVRNGCARVATCVISTDVSPQPQTVEVPPASGADVTTFMGAAAQAFTARVGCVLR